MKKIATFCLLALASLHANADAPREPAVDFGLKPAYLAADYWIAQLDAPDAPVADRKAIARYNRALVELDDSVHDLAELPDTLARDDVQGFIEALSATPSGALYGADGEMLSRTYLANLTKSLALDRIPASQATRFGLVVTRAPLRTYPTLDRVFREPGAGDIDRFQENVLFPGTPVAIVHDSADGAWSFVVSPLYRAWIEKRHVAVAASRDVALGYGRRTPRLVVTGAEVETVYTPENPRVSEVQLDMGVSVPLVAAGSTPPLVNGQHAAFAHVVELPTRGADGALAIEPALVPRSADVRVDGALPYTRANVVRQSLKFLGERYGWGHDYGARDCSGFVSEVYRSMGLTLPRNTSDQARSPALEAVPFDASADDAARRRALATLDVGDLVYIPGHVMMVIGRVDGAPWVIHDTTGITVAGRDGKPARVPLNGVSITPLATLLAGDGTSLLGRITAIKRIPRAR